MPQTRGAATLVLLALLFSSEAAAQRPLPQADPQVTRALAAVDAHRDDTARWLATIGGRGGRQAAVKKILTGVTAETTIRFDMQPFQITPGGQIPGLRDSALVTTAEAISRPSATPPCSATPDRRTSTCRSAAGRWPSASAAGDAVS